MYASIAFGRTFEINQCAVSGGDALKESAASVKILDKDLNMQPVSSAGYF